MCSRIYEKRACGYVCMVCEKAVGFNKEFKLQNILKSGGDVKIKIIYKHPVVNNLHLSKLSLVFGT